MLNFIQECLEALIQMVLASVWLITLISVFTLTLKGFLWTLAVMRGFINALF